MTERGLKNINVFYSTFTNVFLFLSRFFMFLTFFIFSGTYFTSMHSGRRSWGWMGPEPLKICRRDQSMFWPLKCHIFHSKLLLDNSSSFTSWRMKDLCKKWKVKLIFRGAWNSLMAWPNWSRPPLFYDRSTPLTPFLCIMYECVFFILHNWKNGLRPR